MVHSKRLVSLFAAVATLSAAAFAEVNLKAIAYPSGRSVGIGFARTPAAPSKASLRATVTYDKGQAAVNLNFQRMEPAVLFGGDITTYVLWAVTVQGEADNLGEVVVESRNCSGSQTYFTSNRIFALMVTAEPIAARTRPGDVVIFVSGEVAMPNVVVTPFVFSDFQTDARPALETISGVQYSDDTPVALKQAQKAVAMAEKMKAEEINPKAVADAKAALAKASALARPGGNKKQAAEVARVALAQASRAIKEAVQAAEAKAAAEAEAKRLAEKAALEKRAVTAETEAQRIQRELQEVAAQREALARESRELAEQRDRSAAERDSIAAELQRIAAEREALRKERDELAGMLKGALSTVAETNETARGVIVSLPGILFDLNQATLKLPSQLTLAKLAGILMVFSNMNLSIEGYTDSSGSDERNLALSTERAKAVYNFLRSQGVAENRMSYVGYGPANPVAPNDTEANRAKNRRVEVVLTQAVKSP